MYYFYCPNCGKEDDIKYNDIPKDRVGNCRDGWGTPVYHYECPDCHNLDAGCMLTHHNDMDEEEEKMYYRHVISMYQNIRGFNTEH